VSALQALRGAFGERDPAVPAQGATRRDVAAQVAHVAVLLAEAADGLAALANDLEQAEVPLAESRAARLMSDVEPHPAPLLDAHALGELLNVDARTVRRWRTAGTLPPAIEIGGVLRWRREVVDRWLQERER